MTKMEIVLKSTFVMEAILLIKEMIVLLPLKKEHGPHQFMLIKSSL
jgi:hypothetical protein